jgi:hypothetical protein
MQHVENAPSYLANLMRERMETLERDSAQHKTLDKELGERDGAASTRPAFS